MKWLRYWLIGATPFIFTAAVIGLGYAIYLWPVVDIAFAAVLVVGFPLLLGYLVVQIDKEIRRGR